MPFKVMMKSFWEVLALSVPRTLALAAGQISLLAIVSIASLFAAGSIAIFTFGYNLQAVPLTIIGVSYSVAAFPTLARLFAAGKKEAFTSYIEAALRHIIFWSVPATVFVIVLRAQLVRVILGAGQFDWSATRLVAAALAIFVVSLAAQSISMLIARAYYAAGNTKKPLYYGAVDVVVSIGSALAFVSLFHSSPFMRDFIESILRVSDIPGTTVLMLAMGYACGSIAECLFSFIFFCKDFNLSASRLWILIFQSFSASIIGASITYIILASTGAVGTVNTTIGLVGQGLLSGLVGMSITVGILHLLKNPELAEAIKAFSRYFKDAPPVAVEATEVAG